MRSNTMYYSRVFLGNPLLNIKTHFLLKGKFVTAARSDFLLSMNDITAETLPVYYVFSSTG